MLTLSRSIQTFAAVALLVGGTAIAMPAFAKDVAPAATPAAKEAPRHRHHWKHHGNPAQWMQKHTEMRIQKLHDALGLTADQESNWGDVAQAMRECDDVMVERMKEHREHAAPKNAIERMRGSQAMSQAHIDGMAKFIDAFEPFYNDLTPAQQAKADAFFKDFRHHGHEGHEGMRHEGRRHHQDAQGNKAMTAAPVVKVK